jgi:hypothetical protein
MAILVHGRATLSAQSIRDQNGAHGILAIAAPVQWGEVRVIGDRHGLTDRRPTLPGFAIDVADIANACRHFISSG